MSFTEKLWIVHLDGSKTLHYTRDFQMKMKDRKVWYKFTDVHPTVPELSVIDGIESWDGAEARCLAPLKSPKGEERNTARVLNAEPDALSSSYVLTALGYRNYRTPTPFSVRLKQLVAAPKWNEVSVREDVQNGESQVVLFIESAKGSGRTHEFTFLPEKDFVLAHVVGKSPGRNGVIGTDTSEMKVSQMDGFWVPDQLNISVGDGTPERNRVECVLHSLSFNVPTDDEMQVKFPPGTLVADSVGKQLYLIKADGSTEQQKFLDSSTGKIIEPTPKH